MPNSNTVIASSVVFDASSTNNLAADDEVHQISIPPRNASDPATAVVPSNPYTTAITAEQPGINALSGSGGPAPLPTGDSLTPPGTRRGEFIPVD